MKGPSDSNFKRAEEVVVFFRSERPGARGRVTCGKIQVAAMVPGTLPSRRKVLLLLRHTGSRSGSGSVRGEVEEGLILYLNTRLSEDYMHFNYRPDAVALTLPRRPAIVKFLNYRYLDRGRRVEGS